MKWYKESQVTILDGRMFHKGIVAGKRKIYIRSYEKNQIKFILVQGRRKQFYIITLVRQNLWTLLNVATEKCSYPYIDTQVTYIVQSTISMQSLLGVWGHAARKILKNRYSEIEFGDISNLIISVSHFN